MFNRKSRRNYLKYVNRKRLEVNDGAFGHSRQPAVSMDQIPRMTKAQHEDGIKKLQSTDAAALREQLVKYNIAMPRGIYNLRTAVHAIRLIGEAIIAENKKKEEEKIEPATV